MSTGEIPELNTLKALFAPDRGSMPSIHIATPPLASYGGLLNAGGTS